MATQVFASIYGQNGNDWGYSNGQGMGFPTIGTVFIPLDPIVTMATATMNSKIKVLDGVTPYASSTEFFTDKTVIDLVTDSNL